jgi:hypothetical protein
MGNEGLRCGQCEATGGRPLDAVLPSAPSLLSLPVNPLTYTVENFRLHLVGAPLPLLH